MLRNLRSLSCRANGEQVRCRVFDEAVRAFTVTINRTMVTIWGHLTRAKSGHTYIHSACLKSTSTQAIDNASWQSLRLELHNTIAGLSVCDETGIIPLFRGYTNQLILQA